MLKGKFYVWLPEQFDSRMFFANKEAEGEEPKATKCKPYASLR